MAGLYNVDELKVLIRPIAKQYGVERVVLFGSYARGEATSVSDIDLRIDSGTLRGYFKLARFHRALEETLAKPVDVLTTGALDDKFLRKIHQEEVVLYENRAEKH